MLAKILTRTLLVVMMLLGVTANAQTYGWWVTHDT